MEKITQRDIYSNHFYEFCKKVELNDKFMEGLKNHRYFKDDMNTVMKFPDAIARKVFILLEFTRLRSTCEEIIKLLRKSGQTEAADELEKYNTSPGRIEVSTEVVIRVNQAKAEIKGTLYYPMTKNPRGKCIIINNVPQEVHMESKRFKSVFEQLYFEVELMDGLTAEEIRVELKAFAKRICVKHEALIVMIISHGEEEKIFGSNACQGINSEVDLIKLSDIVDIFSSKNLSFQIPRLFFFTCCREKDDEESAKESKGNNLSNIDEKHENRRFQQLKTIDSQWAQENKDTFISYSCSEGFKTFYDPSLGITHFGQALSHSIAQYACEESLQSILSRTCDFIDKFVELSERSAPELRGQCMRRQLVFNPGHHK